MKIYLFLPLALLAGTALGQTAASGNVYGIWEDVVNFSNLSGGGSARMNGIANAQVGLGGDISNAATNPAGLGMLRKSEFSFSPTLLVNNTTNTQAGNQTKGSGSNFNIGQFGIVAAHSVSDVTPGAFRGGAFAATLTRLNNFNTYRTYDINLKYDGVNKNSYIDKFFDDAASGQNAAFQAGQDPNQYLTNSVNTDITNNGSLDATQFATRYAYSRYLLDYVNKDGKLYYTSLIPAGDVNQKGRIYDKGYQNQIDLAYGFNLNNKLFLGGGMGIPYLNATRQVRYTETLMNVYDTSAYAQQYKGFSFDRREEYTWSGVGVNFKVGGIYKLNDNLRVGLSAQTPSWYSITTNSSFSLDPNFTNQTGKPIYYPTGDTTYVHPTFNNNQQQSIYRLDRNTYSMRTPGQVAVGLSWLDKSWGFVSGQVSIQSYSMAKLTSNTYAADNAYLQANTRQSAQARLGAEFIVSPAWRLRAGAAWLQNPVKGYNDTYSYNVGAGVRMQDWYLDLSINKTSKPLQYTVFSYSPTINSIARYTTVQLTLGTYF